MSKKLLEKIEQLEKRIAELENNKTKAVELPFWMPEDGQVIYYLDRIGGDWQATYSHNGTRQELLIGNYYQSKALAQRHAAKLKLLEEIKQWRGKYDPESFKLDWDNEDVTKWELGFIHGLKKWEWTETFSIYNPLAIYLSEDAPTDKFLEHFGNRLDLLLEGDGE